MMEDNCKGGLLVIGNKQAVSPNDQSDIMNSNRPSLSNTSSQQSFLLHDDNSDYQWFLDYGGGATYRSDNNHPSLLSLSDSYQFGCGDDERIFYDDTFARNMDANLAEVDMDTFRTEDIHALLTNLPPMCIADQDTLHRQGESYASVSASLIGHFVDDTTGSSSPPSTSTQGEVDCESTTSMSICKSELLFSPVKESPLGVAAVNFSIDSLDSSEHDLMLTCQANKDNYTIAFEGGSTIGDSMDEFDKSSSDASTSAWPTLIHHSNLKKPKAAPYFLKHSAAMTQSDYATNFTTWSTLKAHHHRTPKGGSQSASGNNNNNNNITSTGGELQRSTGGGAFKSQSMPDLLLQHHQQQQHQQQKFVRQMQQRRSLRPAAARFNAVNRRPVKVFDIQHQNNASSSTSSVDMLMRSHCSGGSDSVDAKPSFNLVKRFMKQKSMSSAEGMSIGLDDGSSTSLSSSSNADTTHHWQHISNKQQLQQHSFDDSLQTTPKHNPQPVNNNNGSFIIKKKPQHHHHLMNKSIQTSTIYQQAQAIPPPVAKPRHHRYKIIEPSSFLNKLKMESSHYEEQSKPIYVMYPNYTLPDLEFLRKTTLSHSNNVILLPQQKQTSKQTPPPSTTASNRAHMKNVNVKRRPFSCNDFEALKKRGFAHIQDWESLNFLLPSECRRMLAETVPECAQLLNHNSGKTVVHQNSTSSSSSGNNFNPLFVYRYNDSDSGKSSCGDLTAAPQIPKRGVSLLPPTATTLNNHPPPRPPLPRGILRTNSIASKHRLISETDDEGVDVGAAMSSSSNCGDDCAVQFTNDELAQFEEFLNCNSVGGDEENLRDCVRKFMALKINHDLVVGSGGSHGNKKCVSFASPAPHNSPNVSAMLLKQQGHNLTPPTPPQHPLIIALTTSIHQLASNTTSPPSQQLILTTLCPTLYHLLIDGLKPQIDTQHFGPINNSLWNLIQTTSQQSYSLTQSLNDLVVKINADFASVIKFDENAMKFNAFVFGLLNVKALDAWLSYFKTRESILRKHYDEGALILQIFQSNAMRKDFDALINEMKTLAAYDFNMDLLYEFHQLCDSFKSKQLPHNNKHRPQSCVDLLLNDDENEELMLKMSKNKRWSGLNFNSKLVTIYNQLDEDDSKLNNSNELPTSNSGGGDDDDEKNLRFRKLQNRWENLCGNKTSPSSSSSTSSKIPRPIQSPSKSSPTASRIPTMIPTSTRTSRLDKLTDDKTSPMSKEPIQRRPSSLPQKTSTSASNRNTSAGDGGKLQQRRAISSSANRKTTSPTSVNSSNKQQPKTGTKIVRTLTHRLPSESGHLSFGEGERLKIIFEVDDKWLLCSRCSAPNERGLVPRRAVVSTTGEPFAK